MRDFPGRCCVPVPVRPNRRRSGYDGRRALPSQPLQSTVNRPRTSTIYDLAELAGTSASTVSAILNGSWQSRRISEETARRVQQLAQEHSFAVNRQASGLRRQRSGLIGMVIPTHEDRFFGALSQAFERLAHARGLCPLVVSTLRDGALEVETVRSLIAFRVEHLIVTGATRPDAISAECRQAGVRHVNVDLPGKKAPSVTSDGKQRQVLVDHLDAQGLGQRRVQPLHGLSADVDARTRLRRVHAAEHLDRRALAAAVAAHQAVHLAGHHVPVQRMQRGGVAKAHGDRMHADQRRCGGIHGSARLTGPGRPAGLWSAG